MLSSPASPSAVDGIQILVIVTLFPGDPTVGYLRETKSIGKFIAPRRQARKERFLSFRPTGEIFLGSLVFTRDDGPRPVILAPLHLCTRHSFFRSSCHPKISNILG